MEIVVSHSLEVIDGFVEAFSQENLTEIRRDGWEMKLLTLGTKFVNDHFLVHPDMKQSTCDLPRNNPIIPARDISRSKRDQSKCLESREHVYQAGQHDKGLPSFETQ